MARKHIATTRVRASSPHVAEQERPDSGKSQLAPSLALAQVLLAATGCSSEQDLIDRIADAVMKKFEARLSEFERRIMDHVTRKAYRPSRHGKPKPGPERSETHLDDLKRVHAYVTQQYSVKRACEIVADENAYRTDRDLHYASVASMRDAYSDWQAKRAEHCPSARAS